MTAFPIEAVGDGCLPGILLCLAERALATLPRWSVRSHQIIPIQEHSPIGLDRHFLYRAQSRLVIRLIPSVVLVKAFRCTAHVTHSHASSLTCIGIAQCHVATRKDVMPTGSRGEECAADVMDCAPHVMRVATGEIEDTVTGTVRQSARAKVGRAGGKARTAALAPEQRSEIFRLGWEVRWR